MAKVLNLFDFTKAELPDVLFQLKVHQKDLDQKIYKAAEHFLTIEDQSDEIQKGDIVAVKVDSKDPMLCSDCDRFNLGKGFYSEEIEAALLGKKTGDTISAKMADSPVEVTVLWHKRRIVPELTDDMAARLGLEDVSTRAEYDAYAFAELEEEDKEKKQNAIWLMVSKQLVENSTFELEPSEIENQFIKDMSYLQAELGEDFAEFMKAKFHGKTMEECQQKYREEIDKTLKLCAIAEPMAEEEDVHFTEDDYNAMIESMMSDEYTEEELKQSMSYGDYVKMQLEEYLKASILAYFDDRFTTTLVE